MDTDKTEQNIFLVCGQKAVILNLSSLNGHFLRDTKYRRRAKTAIRDRDESKSIDFLLFKVNA